MSVALTGSCKCQTRSGKIKFNQFGFCFFSPQSRRRTTTHCPIIGDTFGRLMPCGRLKFPMTSDRFVSIIPPESGPIYAECKVRVPCQRWTHIPAHMNVFFGGPQQIRNNDPVCISGAFDAPRWSIVSPRPVLL